MGPLSSTADLDAVMEQRRKNIKMLNDENRKQQLHKVRLAKDLAKVEQVDKLDISKTLTAVNAADKPAQAAPVKRAPLAAPTNPEAGPSDRVPALLTPGEAVIPAPVAQDPQYQPFIKALVDKGRMINDAVDKGVSALKGMMPGSAAPQEVPLGSGAANNAKEVYMGRKGQIDKAVDQSLGYADGTPQVKAPETMMETVKRLWNAGDSTKKKPDPKAAPLGSGMAAKAADDLNPENRALKLEAELNKAQGFADGTSRVKAKGKVKSPLAVSPVGMSLQGFADGTDGVTDWFEATLDRRGLTEEQKDLARSIYKQESQSGKVDTSNPNYAGARGPMQVIQPTFNGLREQGMIPVDYSWDNPQHSTEAGIALIQDGFKRYGNDPDKVAAYYFSGPDAIKDGKIVGSRKGVDGKTVDSYVADVRGRLNARPAVNPAYPEKFANPNDAIIPAQAPEVPVPSQFEMEMGSPGGVVPQPTPEQIQAFKDQKSPQVLPHQVLGNNTYGNRTDPLPQEVHAPRPEPKLVDLTKAAIDSGNIDENYKLPGDIQERMAKLDSAMASEPVQAALAQAQASGNTDKNFLADLFGKIFGPTGLFDERELLKFAVLAAGGIATGASVGGSIRWAGIAAMNSAEHRYNAQQAEKGRIEAEKRAATQNEKIFLRQQEVANATRAQQQIDQAESTYYQLLPNADPEARTQATRLFIQARNEADPRKREAMITSANVMLGNNKTREGGSAQMLVNRADGEIYEGIVRDGKYMLVNTADRTKPPVSPNGIQLMPLSDYRQQKEEVLKSSYERIRGAMGRGMNDRSGKPIKPEYGDSWQDAQARALAQESIQLWKDLGPNVSAGDFAVILERGYTSLEQQAHNLKVEDRYTPETLRKYVYANAVIDSRKMEAGDLYSVKDSKGNKVPPSAPAAEYYMNVLNAIKTQETRKAKEANPAAPAVRMDQAAAHLENQYKALPQEKKADYEARAKASRVEGYSPFLLWVRDVSNK